jgi:excisionase family DNA binding protein
MKHDQDVLTAKEAGVFLRAHVETLRRLARRGEIPAFKVGKDWRFRREALVLWADGQSSRGGAAKVLIVDDELDVCLTLSRMVERAGFRARITTSASDGLDVMSHDTPDLILLDLMMPGMSGPEFLSEIRKIHPDMPVVIVTGYPDSELMQHALRFGPVMLLAKPVARAQLERTLRMALGETAMQGADAVLNG